MAKKWNIGDRVVSNDNKFKGTVVEIVSTNKVNVDVIGYGKMEFGNRELKRSR